MKVFIVQYGTKIEGVFSTWDKAEEYIVGMDPDNVLPDFSISTEEVQ